MTPGPAQPPTPLRASAEILPRGNDILVIAFRLPTSQCKCTFTKRFTLYTS